MDFFDRQDRSRKKTKHLVLLFGLAVCAITAGIYAALRVSYHIYKRQMIPPGELSQHTFTPWDSNLFLYTAIGTLLLIAAGSIYKIRYLAKGGSAVARMLGATLVPPSTKNPQERMLRNVVEEMAIASGVPVPDIFLLPKEKGINAFAAGFSPSDAVVGVTQGALSELDRDELQGVIAHEFSHILNGDMRLNIRLMGLLHGILVIGLVGYILLRAPFTRGARTGRAGLPIALSGLMLLAVGFIGVFFGKLIKAAVSRQREFLADASAVQFTRNPAGISGALQKIGGIGSGSKLRNRHASEVSHMTFGSPGLFGFFGLLATHPPLQKRIQAIDPRFLGTIETAPTTPTDERMATASLMSSAGAPTIEHLESASKFRANIPPSLNAAITEPLGSQALIYGLVLNASGKDESCVELLQRKDPNGAERTLKLRGELSTIGNRNRLEWIDLALPSLRSLPAEEFGKFRETLLELIKADQKVSLFELTLIRILDRHVQYYRGKPNRKSIAFRSFRPLSEDVRALLSLLAHHGSDNEIAAIQSFDKGWKQLQGTSTPILPTEECDAKRFHRSLERCSKAAPLLKREILGACSSTVSADGKVTWKEAELLRAIGDTFDVPIPRPLSS